MNHTELNFFNSGCKDMGLFLVSMSQIKKKKKRLVHLTGNSCYRDRENHADSLSACLESVKLSIAYNGIMALNALLLQ